MQSSGTSKNQGLIFIYKREKSLAYIRLCGQGFHVWKPNGGLSPVLLFSLVAPPSPKLTRTMHKTRLQ